MKHRSNIQSAFDSVKPTPEQKERMLENIFASDPTSAGKDVPMKRKNMKPIVIAAIITLMVLLMGCAVVALTLQDMKIGENVYPGEAYLDDSGDMAAYPEIVKDVFSLQGVTDSPGMQAAKEWREFYESYNVDGELIGDAEAAGYVAPREYDAYFVYDQAMQDMVDEIAQKYGLQLAGREAVAQSYQSALLLDALGMEDLHHTDTNIKVEYLSGYFFECGNFNLNFTVMLDDEISDWPYEILAGMRYCDKAYMDTVYFTIGDIESVQQWNYKTSAGSDILIIMGNDFARYFYDREDAFVSVSLNTDYRLDSGEIEYMSKRDVELVADAIDFEVTPQKPDMNTVIEALQKSEQEHLDAQNMKEYIGYDDFILDRLEKLGDKAHELYYCYTDLNEDGIEELILGGEDQIDVIWTMIYGEMKMIMNWGENFKKLEAEWPTMDKKPITEYFGE